LCLTEIVGSRILSPFWSLTTTPLWSYISFTPFWSGINPQGFSAVSSVGSPSAFVGIEGTAQNSDLELAFCGLSLGLALFGQMRRIVKKQSCSVSTTATNSHN
jgi:hypothetical protein